MAINNRSTINIEKQMLEDVVMVEELFEETALPDVVLEETDNKKMPGYKRSRTKNSSIFCSQRFTSLAPKQCSYR